MPRNLIIVTTPRESLALESIVERIARSAEHPLRAYPGPVHEGNYTWNFDGVPMRMMHEIGFHLGHAADLVSQGVSPPGQGADYLTLLIKLANLTAFPSLIGRAVA